MIKSHKIALILLGVIILGLLVLQTPLLRMVRDRLWQGWIQTVGDWLRIGSLTVDGSVEQQLNRLTAENVRLKATNQMCEEVARQVGGVDLRYLTEIPVKIAPHPFDPFGVSYVINKGANDGVQLNAPVVISGPVMIGFISQLEERTAALRLLYHPESTLPAEILLEDTTGRGLVKGKAYTSIMMSRIPRDIAIETGQQVVTSEQAPAVPGGILIGQIDKIVDEEHEPYRSVYLTVPYRADALRAAVVLINQQ